MLRADGDCEDLPTMPMSVIKMQVGDSFRHLSAGGGGYGDPRKRQKSAIIADVLAGKLTQTGAMRDYGVTVADSEIAAAREKYWRKGVGD
jgi:N-methylhydantoinase B